MGCSSHLAAAGAGLGEGRGQESRAWHSPTQHLRMARRGPAKWHGFEQERCLNSQTHLPLLQQHLAVPMISLSFLPTYPPAHLSDLPNSHLSLATANLLLGLLPCPHSLLPW